MIILKYTRRSTEVTCKYHQAKPKPRNHWIKFMTIISPSKSHIAKKDKIHPKVLHSNARKISSG